MPNFRKQTDELLTKVSDKDGNEHMVWMIPAPFCATRYTKDSRKIFKENTLVFERVRQPLENNVRFLQSASPSTTKAFYIYRILSTQALCNAAIGGDRVVPYKDKNTLYGRGVRY